ncbi:MAG TPA: class I lanthipeptide [Candidatus Kapabacteria bacterium]|nr:class I lanthipeptide [Candidatus Kapabacteria bacterium]
MKPKKFEKSLTLKKQTIVDLNEMKNVKAGSDDVPDSSWGGTRIVCCASGCIANSACVCW